MNKISNEKKILILFDYKGYFSTKFVGSKENHIGSSMHVQKLCNLFNELGYIVEAKEFSQINPSQVEPSTFILYASSEDRGLFYKHYIEDVILSLAIHGCIPIPSFRYLQAHNNKVFQELLRTNFEDKTLHEPSSIIVGELSELKNKSFSYPLVLKISSGSGSQGVVLVNNQHELIQKAKYLMKHKYSDFYYTYYRRFGLFLKRAFRIAFTNNKYNQKLFHVTCTNKIILQPFIKGLSGDYKVLVFGSHYFVLFRSNRKADFRASGSGSFTFPTDITKINKILEFAERVGEELKTPLSSLDIATDPYDKCYLLEFQCLFFGPYTLQYAPCCFYRNDDQEWTIQYGTFDIEQEYVYAINRYIDQNIDFCQF